MGLLTNRVDRSEIKPGDHIYTYRAVFAYSHHGKFTMPPSQSLIYKKFVIIFYVWVCFPFLFHLFLARSDDL